MCMNIDIKKKIDYRVILIIIATILVLGYLIFFNVKKNKSIEIEAVVKTLGNDYVIIMDDKEKEYLVNTTEDLIVGDEVLVVLKGVKEGNPGTGKVVSIKVISSKEDSVSIDNKDTNEVIENDSLDDGASGQNDLDNESMNVSDNDLVTYFEDFSNQVDSTTEFKSSLKEKFVLVVDFLFYDGEIKGKTFKELSTSAKLEILKIFLEVDNKLETKFPDYKDTISGVGNRVYTNVKTKALELYFDITTEVCANASELCVNAKEGLKDLKVNFSITWDLIKEMSDVGINKLKSWYEIWKEV